MVMAGNVHGSYLGKILRAMFGLKIQIYDQNLVTKIDQNITKEENKKSRVEFRQSKTIVKIQRNLVQVFPQNLKRKSRIA